MAGKKTIVLTIDPAKRLADALGLKQFNTEIQRVRLENLNVSKNAETAMADLYAMMLDPKSTFDQLVARYAAPEFQKKIFKNRYYQHLSGNMAGSHEYMAMEKLYEIFNRNDYDLIVLDTPPSRRALDFLEAPQKMLNILGHNFFMKMFKPYLKVGKWGSRFLNILASPVLKAISKIVGKQAIGDFFGFMQLWDDIMFDGFSRRAASVKTMLGGSRTMFFAVATPQRLPMEEAVFLSEKLLLNNMAFGGFIVNRVHSFNLPADGVKIDPDSVFSGMPVDAALKKKMITAYANMQKLVQSDAQSIRQLQDKLSPDVFVLKVPFSGSEIASLNDLYQLSRLLEQKGA